MKLFDHTNTLFYIKNRLKLQIHYFKNPYCHKAVELQNNSEIEKMIVQACTQD